MHACYAQPMSEATKPGAGSQNKAAAGATLALVLLTALNFVNYIDRYVLAGVNEQIKTEFQVSDEKLGTLVFWFLMVYMVAAPFTGWLGDHFPRKPMIVAAAIFWSTVNLFTGYVHTFNELNIRHAALGLGEASFGIFAPAILADFYPQDQRNRVLTIFNVAVPVGAAMGFALGGFVGQHYGWRRSFEVSAFPGILIALLIAFFMTEPKRTEADKQKLEKQAVLGLVRNPAYLCAVLGYAAVTFTVGGMSFWMPGFLQRADGMAQAKASFVMGAITVAGGLLGTIAGGTIAQRWSKTNPAALYLVPAWSALLAFFPAAVCFFGPRLFHTKVLTVPSLALAIFLVFLGSGPVNAACVNAVSTSVRSTALAGQLLMIHLLGDAPSPTVIGTISDHTDLSVGLGATLVTLLLAAGIFFFGSRFAKPLSGDVEVAA